MRRRGAKVFCEQCKIKKHLFSTQEKAEQYMQNLILNAMRIDGGLPQRVYYCESCGGWHMTSKAHILQKYIDDGSAVLNPKPIIVEQTLPQLILHEDRLQNLKKFYESWERKYKEILELVERREIIQARKAIETLVKNRVNKKKNGYEREYFIDWRRRLVEKTLQLKRRVNNILECNTKKFRPAPAEPVIKCRYVAPPPYIPNPFETITELRHEATELYNYVQDPNFYTNIASNEDYYKNIKSGTRRISRYLRRNEDEVMMTYACFSIGAEPLKSIVNNYEFIRERIEFFKQMTDKKMDEITWERLQKLSLDMRSRIKNLKPEIQLDWSEEPFSVLIHEAI